MKKLALLTVLLLSAAATNAFDAARTTPQARSFNGPPVQRIVLDGNQQFFIVPHDGPYIVSINANVLNQALGNSYVTIGIYVNNDWGASKTFPAPVNQVTSVKFSATIRLKQNDIITFNWISTQLEVSLQPVNNSPAFEATIYPAKEKIE